MMRNIIDCHVTNVLASLGHFGHISHLFLHAGLKYLNYMPVYLLANRSGNDKIRDARKAAVKEEVQQKLGLKICLCARTIQYENCNLILLVGLY